MPAATASLLQLPENAGTLLHEECTRSASPLMLQAIRMPQMFETGVSSYIRAMLPALIADRGGACDRWYGVTRRGFKWGNNMADHCRNQDGSTLPGEKRVEVFACHYRKESPSPCSNMVSSHWPVSASWRMI
jgi:hypothetical protein